MHNKVYANGVGLLLFFSFPETNGEWWRYEYNEQSDELEKKYTGISATAAIGYEYGYDSRGRNVRVDKKLLPLSDGALTD